MTSDATWASLVIPREEDDNSYGSMLSLHAYKSDTELGDESDLESDIDVTRLYRYGKLECEWGEMMEEETMEELNMNAMLSNYMESHFSSANPQQAFPGSMELL